MDWPKISVVVPSYNQAPFLEQALLSVLDQRYPNLELIVIDGGSTDGSRAILERYAPQLAYWVSEPDGGQTRGLIKGFARSSGEIQCWLNSDDLLEAGSLAEVARYFQAHPEVDAVYGDTLWVDREGRPLRAQREIPFNRFLWLYTYNYIPGMSTFWRRALYERVGGLDASFDLAMDADLWIRFAEVGRIGHVRRLWSRSRFYPEQKNRRLRERSNAEGLRIHTRYWGRIPPARLKALKLVARAWRVLWKLSTGCYPLGYRRYMERA
jgi:glycosyltransferase involved in cell wall biosynthesis